MKKHAVLLFFLLTAAVSFSQSNAYLIPRRIYIGDPAVLILPLPGSNQDTSDIILTALSPGFPSDPNIDFHRIILERRTGGGRLLIEFSAYVPGLIELPVIAIDGEFFGGLTVTVNSLIDNRTTPILSGPASSLAIPGTALMLYGTMAFLIVFILMVIWFIVKGRAFLQKCREKWKRWRLFVSIKITEKRLNRSVLKGENKRLILDKLSDEFRSFLSFLTGSNCSVMTAREFEKLSLEQLGNHKHKPSFLPDFFSHCDELRFSGSDINADDVLKLLADLRFFVKALEKAKKEKPANPNSMSENFQVHPAVVAQQRKFPAQKEEKTA